jgi:DNA-binding CsgD family transcriptional regulator/PAS domain-containing protein
MAQREVKTGKPDDLEQIFTQFYEAVLEPEALLPALSRFDRWLGSSLCHLLGWDRVENRARLSLMTRPEYLLTGEAYANYYADKDPRRALVNGMREGSVIVCSDYFDSRFVNGSEFYQDLLIRNSLRYSAGGCLFREASLDMLVVFNHQVDQPSFSPTQVQAIKRLFPHLRQTLKLVARAASLRAGLVAGEIALQSMGQALFVLDRHNDIVYCNAAGEALFGEHVMQRAVPAGLRGLPLWTETLADVLAEVRATRRTASALSRTPRAAYCLTIVPLPREGIGARAATPAAAPGHTAWSPAASDASRIPPFERADLMIIVAPHDRRGAASPHQLAQMFGLSPAESRLAHNLAKGLSVEEHAAVAGVSVTTARNQLRIVLGKTGYRRQQDLVRALSSLPWFADELEPA